MWPFRKKNKLTKKKLLINIAIGSACALVIAGVGVAIGYVLFIKKKNSQTNSTSPYFTATVTNDTLKDNGHGSANVHIDLFNGADFSKLSFDPEVYGEYFSATKDSASQTFTITDTDSTPLDDYRVKINGEGYESQEILISVIESQTPYFTATVTSDTLDSNGDGDAVVKIDLRNDADFSKLSFDPNGTAFTADKNINLNQFKIRGKELNGIHYINIVSQDDIYESQQVGITVDDPGPPKMLIQGYSVWDTTANENDSTTYKTIYRNDGVEVSDVTYNVTGLPVGFSFTTDDKKLIIQGSGKGAYNNDVTITATSPSYGKANKTLRLKVHKFVNVPVNTTFYDIDGTTSVIKGFSTAFLNVDNSGDTDKAKQYLISNIPGSDSNSEFCMDLHDQKITSEQYAFNKGKPSNIRINNILGLFTKLDFSNTQWQWGSPSTTPYSGYYTFGNDISESNACTFTKAKILDLHSANFAVENGKPTSAVSQKPISTGAYTFCRAKFPELENINFYGSVFATNNLVVTTAGQYLNYFTAYDTFSGATFLKLETLDLSGVVFATYGMTKYISIQTAHLTFENTHFNALKNLSLSGAIFAATNMRTENPTQADDFTRIYTANSTFTNAYLESLEILDLSGALFAADSMGYGNIKTASYTFTRTDQTSFKALKILNLSGAIFATSGMAKKPNGPCDIGCRTFASGQDTASYENVFDVLETLNLSGAVFAVTNMSGSVKTGNQMFYRDIFKSLSTLNLSGATFAAKNMTTTTGYLPGNEFFNYVTFKKLNFLNLGNCKIGTANDGTNTFGNTFFNNLQNKIWTSTNKLHITSVDDDYWKTGGAGNSQLNTWLGGAGRCDFPYSP